MCMKNAEYKDQFIGSMKDMHESGRDWLFLLDIAADMTSKDEAYMRRYCRISSVLGYVGIKLSEKPIKFSGGSKLYPTAYELVQDGLVERSWENPEAEQGNRGRRTYRITPDYQKTDYPLAAMTEEEMADAFPEHNGNTPWTLHLHPEITLQLTDDQTADLYRIETEVSTT